jgi:hypothetical protein
MIGQADRSCPGIFDAGNHSSWTQAPSVLVGVILVAGADIELRRQ